MVYMVAYPSDQYTWLILIVLWDTMSRIFLLLFLQVSLAWLRVARLRRNFGKLALLCYTLACLVRSAAVHTVGPAVSLVMGKVTPSPGLESGLNPGLAARRIQ